MFSPGDLVVCVCADGANRLEKGRIYEIEAVGVMILGSPGVDLVGMYKGPVSPAWYAERFRACRKTDISALRALVAQVGS
jgi:hypothetical protein